MQINKPALGFPVQKTVSKPIHFAGWLSDDERRLSTLRAELRAMDDKMALYERRGEMVGHAAGAVGAGAVVATGAAAGLVLDGVATVATGGANLLIAPGLAGAGGIAVSSQAAEGVGQSFKKGMKSFIVGLGKFFNADEQKELQQSVSSLESKVNSAKKILNTLSELERIAQKAKYPSQLTEDHRQAYLGALQSEYTELKERRNAIDLIMARVPGTSLFSFSERRTPFRLAIEDLNSNDIRTRALALRRLYQAEQGYLGCLEVSPAIYQQQLFSPEERVAAAALRAMVEAPDLRPGHYNQVLTSALVSGKSKLQKAALLGLKEQLQPNGNRAPYYFRSILVDQALQDIQQGRNVSGKNREKLQALAQEVLALRNQNREMPDKTVVEEAAEMATRSFAGNSALNENTKTYLSIFQQATTHAQAGTNLMLFSAGIGGIGKTQYTQNLARESLGPDSLLHIDLSSLSSLQALENALISGATGYRDGKYRFDGRTIFMDEFHQLGKNPAREQLFPLLKKITGKEDIPNMDLKNTIVSMASNDEPDEIRGLQQSTDGKTLVSRLESFPRHVNLSADIREDIDGFVHRYINAKAYRKDYPHLEGVHFFPNATRYFQEQLKANFPANGSRPLKPRVAIASISQLIEDAMANTPGFKQNHVSGIPFIIDRDLNTGLLTAGIPDQKIG